MTSKIFVFLSVSMLFIAACGTYPTDDVTFATPAGATSVADCADEWHEDQNAEEPWVLPGNDELLTCIPMLPPSDLIGLVYSYGYEYDEYGSRCGGTNNFTNSYVFYYEWPGNPLHDEIYAWTIDTDVGCLVDAIELEEDLLRARVHANGLVEVCVPSYDLAACFQIPDDVQEGLYLYGG